MSVKDREDAIEALRRSEAALANANRDVERARETLENAEPGELTVRELARRYDVTEENLDAFAEALGAFAEVTVELMGELPISVTAARRAALVAASGHAWERELGPMLTSAQVREMLGGVSRQRVDELLRTRRLIGLRDRGGRRRFPVFQFTDGRPQEPLVDAFWAVADGAVSDWTAASWCVSEDDVLDGLSPVRWTRERRDPERLLRVARQDAARLAQ